MKKYYYFVAKYVKNGITRICTGTQETDEGYFDFVSAGNFIAQENDVDYKDVIVTFWSEINSIMFDKYRNSSSGSLRLGLSDYPFNRPERISLSPEWN